MCLGLFDARRKALGSYEHGWYPHPTIRHQLLLESYRGACLRHSEELFRKWLTMETAGWTTCAFALEHLTLEALAGNFGQYEDSRKALSNPISSIHHSYNEDLWDTQLEAERALRSRVVDVVEGVADGADGVVNFGPGPD